MKPRGIWQVLKDILGWITLVLLISFLAWRCETIPDNQCDRTFVGENLVLICDGELFEVTTNG